jgi:hypothetical protein
MRLKLMGHVVELGWMLGLGSGLWFVSEHRWGEVALATSVFLIGRSVDLLIARMETTDGSRDEPSTAP